MTFSKPEDGSIPPEELHFDVFCSQLKKLLWLVHLQIDSKTKSYRGNIITYYMPSSAHRFDSIHTAGTAPVLLAGI